MTKTQRPDTATDSVHRSPTFRRHRLTLGSYNIHACVGGDGKLRPDRTASVLREISADVMALQEVEHHHVGSEKFLQYLGRELGLDVISGPTLKRQSRHYGNALMTRLPVLDVQRLDLSIDGREPRGALDVALDCDGRVLQVIATHLGLKPGERRRQIRRILTRFETRKSDYNVLMGDLNEWLLWGRPLRWLRGHFEPMPNIRTYPARFPLLALDRLSVNPSSALVKIEAHHSAVARIASDHLPLKAELAL